MEILSTKTSVLNFLKSISRYVTILSCPVMFNELLSHSVSVESVIECCDWFQRGSGLHNCVCLPHRCA